MATTSNLDRAGDLAEYETRLRLLIDDYAQQFSIPGLCLEVAANGWRVGAAVGTRAVGSALPMTRMVRFSIGTLGDMLVAWAVHELAAGGQLNISDPISIYLPEFKSTRLGEEVQINHLVTQCGGHQCVNLRCDAIREHYSWPQCVDALRDSELVFRPGTVCHLSPIATALLEETIFRVSHSTASQFVRSRLLTVLGIAVGSASASNELEENASSHRLSAATRTLVRTDPIKISKFWCSGPGDFTMSISDLVTLYEAITVARGASLQAPSPLRRSVALSLQEQMVTMPFATGGPRAERLPLSVGLGCAEFAPGWVGNAGPAFGQSVVIRYSTTHQIVIGIGANVNVQFLCEAIVDEVIQSLQGNIEVPWEPIAEQMSPTAEELVGTYISPSGQMACVTCQEGRARPGITCELDASLKLGGTKVAMTLDFRDRWVVCTDSGRWPYGVFRDPATGRPCLMIGRAAFKKVSSSTKLQSID